MPSPSASLATLRPDLQTFFQYDFAQNQSEFIAPQVFPIMPVAQQSGTYGRVPVEELLRKAGDIRRAPGSGYVRDTYEFETASYATEEYGVEEILDDREVRMYRNYLEAELVATARARNKILTEMEKRVAAQLFDVTTYTGSAALNQAVTTGAWSVLATSTPINDVELAVRKVWANTGLWPNALVINRHTFRTLRQNKQIQDVIASAGAGDQVRKGDITTSQLSQVFDLPYIFVAGGAENSANPGAAATIASIWGNHAMVCRIATNNDMREPCIGRTFHWSEDGSQIDGRIETYREEAVRGEVIRVRHECDEQRLYTEMGCMIPNCIS